MTGSKKYLEIDVVISTVFSQTREEEFLLPLTPTPVSVTALGGTSAVGWGFRCRQPGSLSTQCAGVRWWHWRSILYMLPGLR